MNDVERHMLLLLSESVGLLLRCAEIPDRYASEAERLAEEVSKTRRKLLGEHIQRTNERNRAKADAKGGEEFFDGSELATDDFAEGEGA